MSIEKVGVNVYGNAVPGAEQECCLASKESECLRIETLYKRTELVAASSGLACSGARDQPPPGGNVRRGMSPMAQVGPAPGEAVLHAHALTLRNDATLDELIQLRSRLLVDAAMPGR